MKELAWINGAVTDLNAACVSLEDRGFLFGDGVYEVARIYRGVPFYLDEHLRRLQKSAAAIMLSLPFAPGALAKIALDLIRQSGCAEGWIYLQLTRGAASRSLAIPAGLSPTLVIFVRGIPPGISDNQQNGVPCITLPDERWLHCNIKAVALLASVLSKEKARLEGAYDAVLYRDGGIVTEASASNVFAVIDGVVRTHPLSNLILPGITREVVLDILIKEKISFAERAFTLGELKAASEVFLTASVAEVVPVVAVDGKAVGAGLPGDLTRRMQEQFRARVVDYCRE